MICLNESFKSSILSKGWIMDQPSDFCVRFCLLRHTVCFYSSGDIVLVCPDGSEVTSIRDILKTLGLSEVK